MRDASSGLALAEAGTESHALHGSDVSIVPGSLEAVFGRWVDGEACLHAAPSCLGPGMAQKGAQLNSGKGLCPQPPEDGGCWVGCLPGEHYNQNYEVWSQRT